MINCQSNTTNYMHTRSRAFLVCVSSLLCVSPPLRMHAECGGCPKSAYNWPHIQQLFKITHNIIELYSRYSSASHMAYIAMQIFEHTRMKSPVMAGRGGGRTIGAAARHNRCIYYSGCNAGIKSQKPSLRDPDLTTFTTICRLWWL